MKKILLLLALLLTFNMFAQTTVTLSGMTQDITLGSNCSNSQVQEQFVTTGDVNLNTYTINLRNASLKVNGYINGNGQIIGCGNSRICTTNTIQNNPIITNVAVVNCNVLSTPQFDINKNYGFNYKLYNINGKLIQEGITSDNLYNTLPKYQILLLKVDGFENLKIVRSE